MVRLTSLLGQDGSVCFYLVKELVWFADFERFGHLKAGSNRSSC